jgi:hypothetical protein
VFENRVLRRIFRPKRDEVTGDWRILHNEELHKFNCSPSIIRVMKTGRMRWVDHVARMGRRGMQIGFRWDSQKERNTLGRAGRWWKDNINVDIKEKGWGGMNWIDLAQNRDKWRALVKTAMNIRVP